MTWILLLATLGVLGAIAVACYRAEAEAAGKLCDCLEHFNDEPDAVGGTSPRARTAPTEIRRERHLRVVRAG